ncbi:hypothetical protein NDU88_004134 [Pleurodeles waltl]|uniref:Uncharacterized protein n=1 Tax=Pleurodeles waltl TaxID=8319 RepID=A0AAV7V2Q7_PLEWA|nr:hypothetical protein NDU88_004134 [Pleurodeles waltl]
MVETVRGGLLRRPAPPVFCPGPALREGPAEPFLPGAELEEEPGTAPGCPNAPPPWGQRQSPDRTLVGQGRVCLAGGFGLLVARAKEPPPRSGLGCMPPQGPSRPGSASRPLGPLAGEAATGHRVRAPAGRGWRAHSRRPGRALQPALPRWAPARVSGEASPAVLGVRGPGSGPPACPSPMGPRVGPSSLPFPGGSQPGCPGRLPQPSRGSGAPGRALPSSRLPFPDGPRPWCPSGPGVWGGFPGRSGAQGPRVGPSHPPGCRSPMGPGPGVRRARVSGEASPAALGLRGPGSGPPILQAALPRWAPALVSVGPGCLGRLPRPLRDSGAPGRALPSSRLPFPDGPRPGCPAGPPRPPRPLRVVRGPGSGPPILQPALRRWAPARVSSTLPPLRVPQQAGNRDFHSLHLEGGSIVLQ